MRNFYQSSENLNSSVEVKEISIYIIYVVEI